ncbi:caspase family protein [Anabaena sp. PCC 7108]|uniref:caspase family protein n=1 Tax=Anabaena sp. PCC 7108 TaxID=163908 RepID=UPI001ED9BAFD|nr:caspase family protein [Anabaena sp. PCC 7108]
MLRVNYELRIPGAVGSITNYEYGSVNSSCSPSKNNHMQHEIIAGNAQPTSKFFALLIGIDVYLPNRLPDGSYYGSLQGCSRDINHVESFLKNTLQIPESQIFKLTASHSDTPNQLKEPAEELPTYENIIAQFQRLTDLAQSQDQVYIHYSGHGGRAATIYPELKGKYGFDESLVPTNIGNSEARYIRDLELAKILQNMVDEGLVVTIVLDSCHSGGATRGGVDAVGIRGLSSNVIDTTPRPQDSLVASTEELVQHWQNLTQGQAKARNLTATSGWLPEPQGYVLLAACRDNEYAYEYSFNGTERNGALTYWLLDSLQKLGNEVTYKVLHSRILAKVNSQFKQQTPMLQGEGDRILFSGQSTVSPSAVIVKKVDVAKNRVLLQAGEAQGLRRGVEFAIYELGTADLTQTHKRVALAKIVELDAEESWAEITQLLVKQEVIRTPIQPVPTLKEGMIQDGTYALQLSPSVKLVRKVCLLTSTDNQLSSGINITEALTAVTAAKARVEGNSWVEFLSLDEPNEEPVSYQVSVNAQGEYEILDAGGELINLRSSLPVSMPNAASSLVNRLVHLAKYQATLELDNNDPLSSLAGKLQIELCQPGENRNELLPLNTSGNYPILNVGEYVILRIRNQSFQVFNITTLAIQPDWSISQLHPKGAANFEPLDPGMETFVRIHTSLPDGYQEGVDVIKVFATVGATNFRYLELPALDQPRRGTQNLRANNPLEELLAAVASEQAPNRNLSAAAYPSDNWTMEQVHIVVRLV